MLGLKPTVPAKGLRRLCISAATRSNKTRLVRRRIITIFSFMGDVVRLSWT